MQSTASLRGNHVRCLGRRPHVCCQLGARPGTLASAKHNRPGVRVQVATTQTVTAETQKQQASWSPWTVLNPFQRSKQTQQQPVQVDTISEAEMWQLLEAEQQGKPTCALSQHAHMQQSRPCDLVLGAHVLTSTLGSSRSVVRLLDLRLRLCCCHMSSFCPAQCRWW
jgi:hypothetical protein